ncbi:hypothetical protein [uncultured Jatrophihabitans sp.]|uniref:hypothetical protein n=1 Tax=uncultured Jatrophihabitans sp. TaxID=1610747 RepID=UPI0035CC4AF8
MTSRWADDELLMQDLTDAVRAAGAVPPDVVAAAKAVYAMRGLDEELAQLTYDSRHDAELAGALRSDKLSVRTLVFGLGELSLDVDVLPGTLVGQVAPAHAGQVVVEARDGRRAEADVDDLGMFSVGWGITGEIRIRVALDDHPAFVTEWTRI